MKINWKLRMKNNQFWIMVGLAIFGVVASIYDVSSIDLTTWSSLWELIKLIFSSPFTLFSIAVAVYNAIVDPTTKGVKDSDAAMKYKKPKQD